MSTVHQGATYTKFALADLDQFLRRTFRALRPVQKRGSTDYFYDLYLSNNVKIQVWSSVLLGDDEVKGKNRPPINVVFMHRNGRLSPEREIRVKRVAGWRDNLRDRIEELIELYHTDPDGWDSGTKKWNQVEYNEIAG